jgi:fluoride exporter
MTPLDVMWVGLGGGLGSLLRWFTGRVVGEHYHGDFPVGTFLINVSGAFAIGFLSVLFKVDWRDRYGTALNAGVLTGMLGYTTFSRMQLDAVKLAGR